MTFENLEVAIFLIIGVCGFVIGLSALQAASMPDLYARVGLGIACVCFSSCYLLGIIKNRKERKNARNM